MSNESIKEELSKVSEAIDNLEALRGKLPEDQLEKALAAYRKRLKVLLAQLRGGSVSEGSKKAGSTISAIDLYYEFYRTMSGEIEEKNQETTTETEAQSQEKEVEDVDEPALSEDEFRKYMKEYLHWAYDTYSKPRLYGLEEKIPESTTSTSSLRDSFHLNDIYMRPQIKKLPPADLEDSLQRARTRTDQEDATKAYLYFVRTKLAKADDVLLPALLTLGERLAILGGSGTGKSTLLAYLTANIADAVQKGKLLPFKLPEGRKALVPLIVPFRYFEMYQSLFKETTVSPAKTEDEESEEGEEIFGTEQEQTDDDALNDPHAGTLPGYITWYLKRVTIGLQNSQDMFERLLKSGQCLLMLDGLDEVSNTQERRKVQQRLEDVINVIYPNNVILITARDPGYERDSVFGQEFLRLYLTGMASDQIESMVSKWCSRINPRKAVSLARDINHLIDDVNSQEPDPEIPPLINSPMMIAVMMQIRFEAEKWPLDQITFYDSIINVILKSQFTLDDPANEERVDWGGTWEELKKWMSKLALEMQLAGRARSAILETRVRNFLAETVSEESLNRFLESVRARGGLLEERAELFLFTHPRLQKFLSALMIVQFGDAEILEELSVRLPEPWWRDTFLQIFQIATSLKPSFAKEFLEWLSSLEPREVGYLSGLELAGTIVLSGEDTNPEMRKHQAQLLAKGLTHKESNADHSERSSAGKTLSQLGDPRFYKGTWFLPGEPLLGFVRIPGGNYLVGSNPARDKSSNSKEYPMHELAIYPFYIARYPVTVAQYRVFIEDSGYRTANRHSLEGIANNPVTHVNWDDAMMYCSWLWDRLRRWFGLPEELKEILHTNDWNLTLPSEPEWEAAARGPRGRFYPWGNSFDARRTNSQESNINTTTSVGSYPQGASPSGILDMSGNVWEWTRSLYRIYYYDSSDGREEHEERDDFRVLRGGSFANNRVYARCAYRNMYYPDYLSDNIGFRVCIHQTHEYEEIEVPIDEEEEEQEGQSVDLGAIEGVELMIEQPGKKDKKKDDDKKKPKTKKIMVRVPVVITGPKKDR